MVFLTTHFLIPLHFLGSEDPTNYKEIVLKIGVQNSLESAFMILLSSKTLKTFIFPKIIIRELYGNTVRI